MNRFINILFFLTISLACFAVEPNDSSNVEHLEEVVVKQSKDKKYKSATNTSLISASDLKKAACCNLGESFTTNPSVDVSYSDAATGARRIKLLGLSGAYVQMLTENIPNLRGAASPYGLGYIPGPWMQSIQVSKGASSVKNGFESTTGQINIEMKKPQTDPSLSVNAYYDILNKLEANVDGNLQLGDKWSAGILTHFENGFNEHDSDGDGFTDLPKIRQVSLMPRIAYLGHNYVFQAAAKFIDERRLSGQNDSHGNHKSALSSADTDPYRISISTRRWEAFTKNAYMFNNDNESNIALILSGTSHRQNALYGLRGCDIYQRDFYASLMYESKFNGLHALSFGLSFLYDCYKTSMSTDRIENVSFTDHEAIPGLYGQYTLNIDDKLIAMAGIRYDHSSVYGSMFTPRLHLRYNPIEGLSLNGSLGRGYRSPHPLAEFSYLLASSRKLEISSDLKQESAWNMGAGISYEFDIMGKKSALSAEYYYTTFNRQLLVDLDSNPHAAYISTPYKPARSHAFQSEITFEPLSDLSLMVAYRYTDVKNNYGHGMVEAPLVSSHKALFTGSFSPKMGLWQFDISCAFNGPGRMPTPYMMSDGNLSWPERYKAYVTLNAQITRNFKHWGIYIGGENLTNYHQPNSIIGADNPWGDTFDATMIYGPLHGANIYVGFRYNITKYL